jgi:hypothetical protein
MFRFDFYVRVLCIVQQVQYKNPAVKFLVCVWGKWWHRREDGDNWKRKGIIKRIWGLGSIIQRSGKGTTRRFRRGSRDVCREEQLGLGVKVWKGRWRLYAFFFCSNEAKANLFFVLSMTFGACPRLFPASRCYGDPPACNRPQACHLLRCCRRALQANGANDDALNSDIHSCIKEIKYELLIGY